MYDQPFYLRKPPQMPQQKNQLPGMFQNGGINPGGMYTPPAPATITPPQPMNKRQQMAGMMAGMGQPMTFNQLPQNRFFR